MNNLNRSMGLNDAYPFVLSAQALAKLEFVHRTIGESRSAPTAEHAAASPQRLTGRARAPVARVT